MKPEKDPTLVAAFVALSIGLGCILAYAAGVAAVLYVLYHFVSKFW